MILRFKGVSAISEFKRKQLLDRLKNVQPDIKGVSAEYVHFVSTDNQLTGEDQKTLEELLTYDEPYTYPRTGEIFLVSPRPGTISPWSSKATAIAADSGLKINRIERTLAYYIEANEKLERKILSKELHDRMTETIFPDIASAELLFETHSPAELSVIDILSGGRETLEKVNRSMGLALSEEEIDYLYASYKKLNRNPTDLELMMFGVVNSEHCRHKIFNADWIIDGKKQPKSLFKMIKNTYEKNPKGVVSAYSDNSAIIKGHKQDMLELSPETHKYEKINEQTHLVAKVETHNHPTAIAPFPGAATGSGGEIRDENATGRGSRAKMGLTGFSVSNLRIPGFIQSWEKDNPGKPDIISSPLDIMLKAPLGGASFNNEFGRPNTNGYFRTFEAKKSDDEIWGYHKPIMIAGGVGSIKDSNKAKERLSAGDKLLVIGGPSMLIGLAGGAASSMESGKSDAELDFASVQRGNAEMQRRTFEVINTCASLGKNPIISIHDVGAGGLSNALTELVHDSGLGAKFELRNIDCAEPGLSPMEIWCNEAQERYVLAISDKDLESFEEICRKEKCPYSVVGETTSEEQLVITDSLWGNRPADIPMSLIFDGPPKITKQISSSQTKPDDIQVKDIVLSEAVERVLKIPSVASKKFLITIADRTVGGLIARDQMVGPWQVPVSDVAVSATGYYGKTGEAMTMGERTPLATINAPSSARMAIGEALTNIAPAAIEKISDIKLSANWMAASGYDNEDYRLYQTVKTVGEDFCPALGLTIPVGKDSLSMRSLWQENGKNKSVASPVSLIISAFAPVSDINRTLTPRLNKDSKNKLIFIDLSGNKQRLGGSALAQAYSLTGGKTPDVENPQLLKNFFECAQVLSSRELISAYHDRSDGGLLTTLLEMAFAGRCGLDINLDKLTGDSIEKLFNEELGIVIQTEKKHKETIDVLEKYLPGAYYEIGQANDSGKINIHDSGENILSQSRSELESIWAETSLQIQKIRDNSISAEEEYALIKDNADPGINPKITFSLSRKSFGDKPKIAILREQGVNGQNEMAGAFTMAGFTAIDVSTKDLLDKKISLDEFSGLAVCGGFSYGDVLGAGLGWAKEILASGVLRKEFQQFFERKDTFSLGVCNGCQMMSGLKSIIPGAQHWPKFLRNTSEQFEARVASVRINQSSSIFFKDMQGSVLPVPVSHGEGRAVFDSEGSANKVLQDKLAPLQFVDNYHKVCETYPLNPNGSAEGITALTSDDGRVLIMMPHPERAFMSYQHSWRPDDWPTHSPWLKIFENAREWVDS